MPAEAAATHPGTTAASVQAPRHSSCKRKYIITPLHACVRATCARCNAGCQGARQHSRSEGSPCYAVCLVKMECMHQNRRPATVSGSLGQQEHAKRHLAALLVANKAKLP
eukprot:715889-Pelagomonas_calceolata.AAC.2